MWPMLLDYTKDESKRILRRLELEAYASIISVFRAQGDLSKDKKKILQDLQQTLSISTERHRAEVRRAINDEKLATIADNIAGTISIAEWTIEGRRLVPLMPRLVPQTAFTATANQAASAMMEKNASLPPPSQTANKDGATATLPKPPRSTSPTSNVVVLPSGTSIHIKGMLNQEDDEDLSTPSRRSSNRSLSTDSNSAASVSTQTPRITYTTASATLPGSSPVKITISKSPQGRPITVQSTSQPPKVILVTSAGPVSGTTVIQRSLSVPIVRTPTTTLTTYGGTSLPRSSVLIPGGPSTSVAQVVSTYPAAVPTASSLVSSAGNMPISTISSSPAMFNPSVQIGLGKVRPRIVPRQRYPAMVPQSKPGVVIPMGPQLVSPTQNISARIQVPQPQHTTSAAVQVTPSQHIPGSIQVKTLNKPTIQIKQEGVKIITQSSTSKILPKPIQVTGAGGNTPVVMVNTGQSTTGSSAGVTMIPRSISSYSAHHGEAKVLNITSPGGRVIATTAKATNVVTVNPKTLHLTAVKTGSGSTTVSKPNVIVVQKTQHPRFPQGQAGTNIRTITSSTLPGAIDKELMGLVHKDAQGGHVITAAQSMTGSTIRGGERRVIITTSSGSGEAKQVRPISIIHRARTDNDGKGTSLLAELIQAVGIPPDGATVETTAQGTDPYDFESTEGQSHTVSTMALTGSSPLRISHPQQLTRLPLQRRQFIQEVTDDNEEEGFTFGIASADKSTSQDADVGAEQVFTLEQAMSLLNKEVVDLTETDALPVSSSGTILPNIQSALPPATHHIHVQPEINLQTKKPFGVDISPEEGLKEGQLDTQTGLFYQVTASDPQADSYNCDSVHSGQVSVSYTLTSVASPASPPPATISVQAAADPVVMAQTVKQPPLDLLSSSLAEAQINLDSYNEEEDGEYEEEDDIDLDIPPGDGQLKSSTPSVTHISTDPSVSTRPGMAEVLREETAKDGTRILTVSNPASSQQESLLAHSNHLVSLPSQLTRSSAISSTTSSSPFVAVQEVMRTPLLKANSNIISVLPQAQITLSHKPSQPQSNVLPIAVSVDKSPSIITLKIDELTPKAGIDEPVIVNQNVVDSLATPSGDTCVVQAETCVSLQPDDNGSTADSDLDTASSDGHITSDPTGLLRSSKRKRKHPSGVDETMQSVTGSWVKTAFSLLMKVARFKGSPRDRSDIPAAEWFTFPVDSVDAPDYYTVIQNPMDFSTMRKKLETGQYSSFEEFQADMELIQTNCYLYNSEGTKVRRDCDEVMTYYKLELSKLQEKQVKAFSNTASPLKKVRLAEDKPQTVI
ncbi:BRCA2-interacting transcriptional repressor EMSY isoform X2 [Biomphalaria pfeifferi]|uniref:BRCA2-interacting transcriptional repressor EMSY isoform X2 n=1 Tax=Biomphalaria pfeifferi TaxID=112525 RepID=A0AAD8BA08_BIOPF|nr:BRCA2-interacting transcriptional repressor EMSY isoform X2 [Biomphalaria pfeifferi]